MMVEDNQTIVLGRGTDTHCRIHDPSISRRHCQITNCAQGLLIADLGSSNGTFVNGQPISHWVALNNGDQIVLGQNQIEILGATPNVPQQSFVQGGQYSQAGNFMQSQAGHIGQNMHNPMQGSMAGMNMHGSMGAGNMQQMGNPQMGSMAGMNMHGSMGAGNMQQMGHQMGSMAGNMNAMAGSMAGHMGSMGSMGSMAGMTGTQMGGMPPMQQQQLDFDPHMVEGYVIESKLGQGAFGAVFRAVQQQSNQVVALKTVRPQLVQNEKDIARFFREAKAGAALVHPNIIRIYDAGESRGCYYIAMEYVEGRECGKLIEQYGRIGIGYSLRVGIQIANALQHAFEQSIVHRDIKPENILVTSQGQAKLVDFGLAKNFQQAGVSGLTAPGEGMGTLAYMPPEQLDNALMADQRSDIYSLGATIYHMISGNRPFNEKTTRKFIMKILNKMPTPLSELNPSVPQHLEEILEKAMAKDPTDRYQEPQEFETELREIFDEMARNYNNTNG